MTASILRVVVSEPPFHVMRHTALLCGLRTYGRLLLSNEASHIILFPVVYVFPVEFVKPLLTVIGKGFIFVLSLRATVNSVTKEYSNDLVKFFNKSYKFQ